MKAWIFTTSFICNEKSGWRTLKTDQCSVRNQIILTIKIYKSSGFDFKLTWSLKYCRRSLYFLRAWCILTIDWIYRKTLYILLKHRFYHIKIDLRWYKGANPNNQGVAFTAQSWHFIKRLFYSIRICHAAAHLDGIISVTLQVLLPVIVLLSFLKASPVSL